MHWYRYVKVFVSVCVCVCVLVALVDAGAVLHAAFETHFENSLPIFNFAALDLVSILIR